MAHVLAFDGAFEAQHDPAEVVLVHCAY
jgi:hypothetical protein